MQIQNCVAGQRVVYQENRQPGTIKEVHLDKNEVDLVLDNGSRIRTQARLVEPTTGGQGPATGPARPCPQCAAKMPLDVIICPICGFQYGVKQDSGSPNAVKIVFVLVVLGAIAAAVWWFLLRVGI